MPDFDHQLLARVIAVVVGAFCIYYVRILVIVVKHHRLQARLKLKQRDLIAMSAEVNRLSQDECHWKQLYEDVSPLDPEGMRRWLGQMKRTA